MQAGGRRFDSVHLHQTVHQAPLAGLNGCLVEEFEFGPFGLGSAMFAYSGAGWPKLGVVSHCSRFQNRMLVLDAASRCLSLWIGLLDEGLKWTPSLWMLVISVRRRRLMARPLSGLDEHVCPLRVGLVPARDG